MRLRTLCLGLFVLVFPSLYAAGCAAPDAPVDPMGKEDQSSEVAVAPGGETTPTSPAAPPTDTPAEAPAAGGGMSGAAAPVAAAHCPSFADKNLYRLVPSLSACAH